jgi:hypothetical protein
MLAAAHAQGVVLIAPPVFSELHAHPNATPAFVKEFLVRTGVVVDYRLEEGVWYEAGVRFARYASRRRGATGTEPRRLVADYIIGAHALLQADCLMTLDPKCYRQDFPELQLI